MSEQKSVEMVKTRNSKKRKVMGRKGKQSMNQSLFMVGLGVFNRQPRFHISDSVYTITQSFEVDSYLTSSTSVTTYGTSNFTFSALDQAASLTLVFDQYRINEIELTLIPQNSEGYSMANAGMFHMVVDLDDSTALSSIGQALDYPTMQSCRGSDAIRVSWKPHVAQALYGGAFTQFGNVKAGWIDTSSQSVQHYGIKTAWTATSTALSYNAITRYNISFRSVR